MMVDVLEVEEVIFTLVTNKKSKKKAKVPSPSPTNSRSKILLVSRAPPVSKTTTANTASKPAATCSLLAVAATTTSKPAQPQSAPPPVPLVFKPKPKVKSFAQATKANNITQQTPRFASASSHEDFLQLLQLKEAFSNLLQTTIISIHQASLGSVGVSQGSLSYSTISKTLKMTTQGPTRCQVLISLTPAAVEMVVANVASVVESCNKSLVSAHSKLRVESVYKTQDGVSISTNSVAFAAKLEVIKQWLKKTAGLSDVKIVDGGLHSFLFSLFHFIFPFLLFSIFYFQNNLGQGLLVMLSHQSQFDGIVTRLIMGLGRMKQKVLEQSDIIQHGQHMLASCYTHGYLGQDTQQLAWTMGDSI